MLISFKNNFSIIITYLLNDLHRKVKFSIALLTLVSFSYYSYNYGRSELPLIEKVKSNLNKVTSFPYLKVVSFDSDIIISKDKWNNYWKVQWPENLERPEINMYTSFMGVYNNQGIVQQLQDVIIHKGYEIKLYISIVALFLLFILFGFSFRFNSEGIYRKG